MALPTATCVPFPAATSLTASCGSAAPGILRDVDALRCGRAAVITVSSGWRLSGSLVVVPAATTVPPWAMATPDTFWLAAVPNAGICRHEAPSAEVNAISPGPDGPVTTAPAGAPLTMSMVKPALAVRVAAKAQAVPLGER